ncbi:unnamed protein product, partial [Haemonchus placei]|uniref:SAM-dependent methyltransferase n=1 Tax=Haemonchus placei TaxID=6290 RepID=A0A0N4WLU1_HAEPC
MTPNGQGEYKILNKYQLKCGAALICDAASKKPIKPVDEVDFRILEEAQNRKMDRLIGLLDLKTSERILEVGCGWGSCAIRAVKKTPCNWTGITISHEQLEWAKRLAAEANLENNICFKYQDYRLTTGQYDKIISVEMIEAVGQAFLPQYFQ